MQRVGLFEAKNRLSELCRHVAETGETCVISRHGQAIAKLVPVKDDEPGDSVWDTLEESQSSYGDLDVEIDIPERSNEQRPNPLED